MKTKNQTSKSKMNPIFSFKKSSGKTSQNPSGTGVPTGTTTTTSATTGSLFC
ncbi:hypothetical protein [Pedobacter sp. B4-66]|uniref:hypothetical protein n=1 Tax=Pedobacter sp. B4-66 TaxID=2817280 RepID=UPI001BD9B7F4|nr:hypothetical protein [Pedobacter sp. B4-66]